LSNEGKCGEPEQAKENGEAPGRENERSQGQKLWNEGKWDEPEQAKENEQLLEQAPEPWNERKRDEQEEVQSKAGQEQEPAPLDQERERGL
jgi:hypothetical protein